MGGLAAVIAFDADPRAASSRDALTTLDVLLRAAPQRAPDGTATWHGPGIALGQSKHLLFDGAPSTPVTRGSHALVFDGRLDNRSDLLARLSAAGCPVEGDDARIALAALTVWGAPAIERFEGIFAFVWWDADARRAIAARDPVGMRPLHWTRHRDRVLVASDVAQLIAVRGIPPPDESAVADLLGGEPPADERTLFSGVHRVPGGCFVVVDAGGASLHRYWTADPAPTAAVRSDDEWASECRALLDRAIVANLRTCGPSGVYFSGGVDSSVVLTLASAAARREQLPAPVPLTLEFTHPDADESAYQRAVAARIGCELLIVQPASIDAVPFRSQAERYLSLPDLPSELAFRPIREHARSAGLRAALTGVGPDMLFSGSVLQYADLLARGHLVGAVRRYWLDRSTESSGWTPGAILTAGLWPLLSQENRTRLRAPARRISGVAAERAWLRLPRVPKPVVPDPPPGVPHASWEIACSLKDGWTSYFIETAERAAADAGFEDRHPLMDRAVITFGLSLPEEQRRRGRITKFVFRNAAPELAPDVAARASKADFGHLLAQALDAVGGQGFFRSLAIADAGWVEPRELAERYNRVTQTPVDDPRTGRDLPMLWMVAATELWFRAAYAES